MGGKARHSRISQLTYEVAAFTPDPPAALSLCWRMIFSENRFPLFGIMR
jgi:hypothetical protein